MQGLLDLCNQPAFAREVYVNLDCRTERGNLFEAVCAVLSKSSFPVSRPLSTSHMLALDGLFSILNSLRAGCAPHSQCLQLLSARRLAALADHVCTVPLRRSESRAGVHDTER